MNGVLVVDKPCGLTSFAVVKRVRRLLAGKRDKVGHGGTLDPFASGVLPVCLGEATKVLAFLLAADKAYDAVLRLGVETDTLDVTGKVVAEHAVGALDATAVQAALAAFRGTIVQTPPMFSALKRDGRPLYAYARAGVTVERAPRTVTIHTLDLLAFEPPDRVRIRVRCSKGTYIRALASDIGRQLGVGAHLLELRRTASGPFMLEQALGLDELAHRVAHGQPLPLLSSLQALAHLPRVDVDEATAHALARGQRLDWRRLARGQALASPACAVRATPAGPSLVAVIAEQGDGTVKIMRGFGAPGTPAGS